VTANTTGISGKWNTRYGVATITQQGDQVEGTYNSDGGRLSGTYREGVLTGIWSEHNSGHRCKDTRHGHHHWGPIRWEFDGDSFTGAWGYCDGKASRQGWNGQRQANP